MKDVKFRMSLRSKRQLLRRFLLTLSLFTVTVFSILRLVDRAKVKHTRAIRTNESAIFLDNLFGTDEDVLADSSIFFLDTTRMRHPQHQRDLTMRQICSIESAALTNPSARIFVIIVAPQKLTTSIRYLPRMNALLDYPNVYLKSMLLVQYTIDTPLERFVADGKIFESKFIRAHTADALRLLLLWKFGGTYLDTDMIVRRELSALPANFVCRDHDFLCNAIMSLKGKRGREFARMFIDDFIEKFNPKEWSENGPFMIGRVLSRLCNTTKVREMHECGGFRVLDDDLCYPVTGTSWELLFDEEKGESLLNLMDESVVVHFWNKLSHMQKIKCDSKAAYTLLANQFCPKTMAYCEDYFLGWEG